MPIVFVHGVNNRRGESQEEQLSFDRRVAFLLENFRQTALRDQVTSPDKVKIFAPYWGDLGVKFPRGIPIPADDTEVLSLAGEGVREAVATLLGPDELRTEKAAQNPLVTVAHSRTLASAVDLLALGAATASTEGLMLNDEQQLESKKGAALFLGLATQYALSNPRPSWLDEVEDDDAFMDRLAQEVGSLTDPANEELQSLSVFGAVASFFSNARAAVVDAAGFVRKSLGDAVTSAGRKAFLRASRGLRPAASAVLSRFVGDVFIYMKNRAPITELVLKEIDAAAESAEKDPDDGKLILIGHSFGGIILYDILTRFRPNLKCDLFVTVGSQVALFAEMNLLANEVTFGSPPDDRLARPSSAERWLNVTDLTDILAFSTKKTFAGTKDFQFETEALPLASHGAYFDTAQFYIRMRERINDAFAQGTD